MKRLILRFGLLAVALIALLELSKYSLLTYGWRNELAIFLIGATLIGAGVLIHRHLVEKPGVKLPSPSPTLPESERATRLKELGISRREMEVLVEIAAGYTNQEIADRLHISENTVKTHVSKLLSKLDAKRRTEAVKNAREWQLLE
ncbi:MAG: response regulator transcription factor [Bacteroidota bacterium]